MARRCFNLENRAKIIIQTSVIGIIANVLLSGFKAAVGFITGSIAITLDAVNNLSDALSSVITIVGTKLAGKAPDKKHPFGHGRVEYLAAMIIAIIIGYAGLTSLIESIQKIITPTAPEYNTPSLIIVAVAIAVKIVLGLFVKKRGKAVHSDVLTASGQDALLDAIISASTLAAAIVFLTTGVSLEAWLGAVISILIIKAGIDVLRETLSQILGERGKKEVSGPLKKTIGSFPEVYGVYDLVLNNYGPDIYIASGHIEVEDVMSAVEIDRLSRRIAEEVYEKHGVLMAAVGIYARNTTDSEARAIELEIRKMVYAHEGVLQLHGFHLNREEKTVNFDVIIDFDVKDREAVFKEVSEEVKQKFPEYRFNILMDFDFTD